MTGIAAEAPMKTTEADWHQWCRLCAKEHPDNVNVYFRDGDQTWTSTLAVAIGKYFWVNIKMEDELSNALCKECYSLVEYLIDFSDRVSRVQTFFNKLQQAGSAKHDELRRECNLMTDDWKHIIKNDAPADPPKEKTEDLMVDEMVQSFDEDDEMMAEIEETELKYNEENSYEAYVEREEVTEESTEKSYAEPDAPNDNAESLPESKAIELADSDANTTTTTTSAIIEDEGTAVSHEPDKFHTADNEDAQAVLDAKYQCLSCNKGYKKPMAYKRHMAEVHGLVPTDMPILECNRCHRKFATENQLIIHYRTHMPAKEKADNACKYCPKMFTTAGALKRHVLCIHENVKPFICDCCGKGMKTITALNEHKLVHTDECPFACPVCPRRFKNMARLKIHSDIHNNQNYECNICGLKLNTRRTLNMHQAVHTDAKQYKCDVCGAAFKRGKTLKAHLILHTGIRPYKCNFCGKDFSNGSNCRMHKRKTHPKELAEEEARGVIRSTLLPMITELTEASKRVKKPAKAGTAGLRIRVKEATESTTASTAEEEEEEDELEEEEPEDEVLYEIVDECS